VRDLNQPCLPELLHRFLYDQLYPCTNLTSDMALLEAIGSMALHTGSLLEIDNYNIKVQSHSIFLSLD